VLPGARYDVLQDGHVRSDVAAFDQELFGARRQTRHYQVAHRRIIDLADGVEADRDAGGSVVDEPEWPDVG